MGQTLIEDVKNNFEKFVGHKRVLADIAASFSGGRLHHAWLLSGPAGIGKATMAKLIAAWLLSEESISKPLLVDDVPKIKININDAGSRLVLNGAHPDYMAIFPDNEDNKSGQIKIDQIRKMIPFLMHKPARGSWRVAVIDAMDQVNRNGANALLKLLEEPPERTVLFLISAQEGSLPPTIRSRCRLTRMGALSEDDCLTAINYVRPDIDQEKLCVLGRVSQGAPGQALKLLDSGAIEFYEQVCSILHTSQIDAVELASLCSKWGRGTAANRETRAGAVFCLDRLLRYTALRAAGLQPDNLCGFETSITEVLAQRHSALKLASFHSEFILEATRAERLHLDFSRFIEQYLTKIYQKTLP